MKTIVFDAKERPSLFIKLHGEEQTLDYEVAEISDSHLIVTGSRSLPLRGEVQLSGQTLKFQKREDHDNYFLLTFKEEDLRFIQTEFLKRLSPEKLSEWLIGEMAESPWEKSSYEEPTINSPHTLQEKSYVSQAIGSILAFLYQRPLISIFLLVTLSVIPAIGIKKIRVDPSLDRLLIQDSPEMKAYNANVERFGSDRNAILFFKDKDIFSTEKLKLLRKFAWELQKFPDGEKVLSVFTTTFIHYDNEEETLYTEPLFSDLDISKEKKAKLLARIQDDPILHERLIDVPKNIIIFVIPIATEITSLKVPGLKLRKLLEPLKSDFEVAFQTGEPTIEVFASEDMKESQLIFLPLICLVLFICFVFFIQSVSAFVVTIFVMGFSTFWIFGIMPYFDIPIQLMINLVPGIILTLSATEIVHIFSSIKEGRNKSLSGEALMRFIGDDIGKALFLTFFTTSLGFLSIRLSQILLLQEFALVSFFGLNFAFIVTLIYVPLHLRLFSKVQLWKGSFSIVNFKRFQSLFTNSFTNLFFSKTPIVVITLFTLFSLLFSLRLKVDNDAFAMIKDFTQVKKNLNLFTSEVGGTRSIHLIIDSDATHTSPEELQQLWLLNNEIDSLKEVKQTESVAKLLSLLNREMRGAGQEGYRVPSSKNLISQYLLTLSRDDLDPLITPDKTRVSLKINHDVSSSSELKFFIKKINDLAKSHYPEDKFFLTSRNILNFQAAQTLVESQVGSLMTMSIVILIILSLFFKSFQLGLLSLVPNLFPIVGLFGIMGLLDIPLNVGTCIVAAITIGIAADDTIHLFSRYVKDKSNFLNPFLASQYTIKDEVVPILTTSLSLALSFSSFTFAKFVPLTHFGLLSCYVLILAVISDLYIGPALLTWYFLRKEGNHRGFIHQLLNGRALSLSPLFKDMSYSEIVALIKASKVHSYARGSKPRESNKFYDHSFIITSSSIEDVPGSLLDSNSLPLMSDSLVASINKEDIKHLSPRIFQKFCNNLGN